MSKLQKIFFRVLVFTFVSIGAAIISGNSVHAADQNYFDLVAESIKVTPASPMLKQTCIILVRVKNGGTLPLVSDQGISDFTFNIPNFTVTKFYHTNPGGNFRVEVNGYVEYHYEGYFNKLGELELKFIADSDNRMQEYKYIDNDDDDLLENNYFSLEDNNTVSSKVTVQPVNNTDIGIDSFEINKNFPVANEPVDIKVNLKNYGKTSLNDSVMFDNDSILASYSGFDKPTITHSDYPSLDMPLDSGATFSFTYKGVYLAKGDYTFSFKIDKWNKVVEADKTNNSSSTKIHVYRDKEEVDQFIFKNISLDNISSTSVRISWETDNMTTGRVNFIRTQANNNIESSAWTSNGIKHSVDLTNLYPGSTNFFQIEAKVDDTTSETSFQKFKTFIDDKLFFTQGPSLNQIDGNTNISWKTNLITNGQLYYKSATGTVARVNDDALSIAHTIVLKNLASGPYEYYIISSSTDLIALKSSASRFVIGAQAKTDTSKPGTQNNTTNNSKTAGSASPEVVIKNQLLYKNLRGKIILLVEANGEAYYVHPVQQKMYFLGRPTDAFAVMRQQGIGISNSDLSSVALSVKNLAGIDTDQDGLPDILEDAIGTDKAKNDTDGDGFMDKNEIIGGFNPRGNGKLSSNQILANASKGKIFLQVEGKGEAWYVNPADSKRYFLGRPADAFSVMRTLGIGVSDKTLSALTGN